ncbi:synaptonemal complex protein 2-like [Mobula hypostoma]|uniref:synaptonemal complex protein 2-like n=1 Tax=Mobula hypostoma TaxID=723540 RepID=UPI002FC30DB6
MKVYNSIKYKQSSMKDRISEVKRAVHVSFDGSSSQVLVAENQLSSPSCKETGKKSHSKAWIDNGFKQDIIHSTKIPKMTMSLFSVKAGCAKAANQKPLVARNQRTSEVSMVVTSTEMLTRKSMSTAVNSTPAKKTRMKPPLEMKNSSGRNITFKVRSDEAEPGNSIYVDLPEERATHTFVEKKSTMNAIESKETTNPIKATSQCSKSLQKKITPSKIVGLLQEEDERNLTSQTDLQGRLNDIVPDSQPVVLKQKSLLPGLLDNIHKGQKCLSKKRCWVSDSPISSCSTVERQTASVKYAFQQDDQIIKHQAFCSIFDEKSPKEDDQNKFKNSKNEALEMQLEGKLEKMTPRGMHERSGTCIKDNYKKTKFTENIASEMDKFKLDEICHNTGCEKQNTPNSNKSSKRYKTDLMCKNQPKKRECDVKENTVTETMISVIAAKYANETKEKYLNKEVPLSTRYRLDELHDKKLQKNLKDEKRTWKRQKGGVACTVNLKNKMEDSALDVYSFDDSFIVEPTVSLGMQNKKMPQQTCSNKRKSKKMNMKRKPTKKEEIHKSVGKVNRKHFFTDTDTDGKTEISWLQQSNRKTKPELVAYSRQRKRNTADNLGKGKLTTTVRTDCGKKSIDKKNKGGLREENNKKPTEKINLKEVPAEKKQRNCPQRAAAMQRCYKEVSESASDSYGESLSPSHYKERDLIMQVPAKKICTNAKEKAIMSADYEQQSETSEASTVVSYENTSAEKIRYEKTCESLVLTRSSSLVESLPSIRTDSSPEPLQSPHLSIVVKNPCKFSRNVLKAATPLSSPDFSAAKSTFTSGFSAIISPISLVTPLCPEINENGENAQQELVKLENPDEDIITNKSQSSENSFETTRSPNNFILSSILSKKATAEETPSRSTILEKNRRGEKDRAPSAEAHTSGPTRHSSVLKRICGKNLQSDFSDVEEEEGTTEQRAKLKRRSLFSFDFGKPNRDPELLSTSNRGSSIKQMDHWGQSEPNMGVICQQFRKELEVKFQRHSQRIDSLTKFSLKSLQQRMSSTNVQIHSYRLQRLNKFQAIVMQELQHFEKDCLSLKCMEKELSNFWKQRSEAFNELKENQEERIQHLRSSLENNVCHSMEIEEKIFSTEMHLMRKDMKAVQNRLLREMQEEELRTVRRGLQSFFLSETTHF